MQYQIRCPNCGTRQGVGLKEAGREIVCPSCTDPFAVPITGITAGTTSDGLWVKRRVGGGYVSDLFEATRIKDDEKLLLKVLCPLLTGEPDLLREYLDGIQKVMEVSHPNIVAPLQTGPLLGHVFIAFPPLAGICLDVYVTENGPMAEREVLKMAVKIARALDHANRGHHLLHHALKPANLLLDEQSQIKVLDLNQQRLLLATSTPGLQRLAGAPPNYFSPEQIEGRAELDCRSDIYALGCTLFFLTTGQPPFPGDDVAEVFGLHLQAPPPAPSSVKGTLTPAFDELVAKMLAKDRDARYQTWEEVIAAIHTASAASTEQVTQTKLRLAVQPKNYYADTAPPAAAAASPPAAAPARAAAAEEGNMLSGLGIPGVSQLSPLHLKILLWTAFGALAVIVFCLSVLINRQGTRHGAQLPAPPKNLQAQELEVKQKELFDQGMKAANAKPLDAAKAIRLLQQARDLDTRSSSGKHAQEEITRLQTGAAPSSTKPAGSAPPSSTKPAASAPPSSAKPARPASLAPIVAPQRLVGTRPTASSEADRQPAKQAFDGYLKTCWASKANDVEWLKVDLGGPCTLTDMELYWAPAYAQSYFIEVSPDDKAWTTVHTQPKGAGGQEKITVPNVPARYVRLTSTARALPSGYALNEWELYGVTLTPAAAPATPQRVHLVNATASTENDNAGAGNAIDDAAGTKWVTRGDAEAQWLIVDCGGTYALQEVNLKWGDSYAKSYGLAVSLNNKDWTPIYTQADGQGKNEKIKLAGQTARYLRLTLNARAKPTGYSLFECEVYGLPPPAAPAPRVPSTASH